MPSMPATMAKIRMPHEEYNVMIRRRNKEEDACEANITAPQLKADPNDDNEEEGEDFISSTMTMTNLQPGKFPSRREFATRWYQCTSTSLGLAQGPSLHSMITKAL
jgi:hypothetical protein